MADSTVNSPRPRRRAGWIKALLWIVAILLVLLVAVFFLATSAGFVKSVVLPRVSKAVRAEVTAGDIDISPFKQITIRDLKVQPAGEEPVLTADRVYVRHHLFDILRGNIHVDEITIDSPTITLIEHPDGTRNYDALIKSDAEPEPRDDQPSEPPRLDIRRLALNNATVVQVKHHSETHRDSTSLSNVVVTIENLKNGGAGRLSITGNVATIKNPPPASPEASPGQLNGNFSGNYEFTLLDDLVPSSLKGQSTLAVSRAEGSMEKLDGFRSSLDCDVTPTDIRRVALTFFRNQEPLGELRAHGPFDAMKREGQLTVQLFSIDRRLLNMIGGAGGPDFGGTTISSTNEIQIANGGKLITARGRFNADRVQVTRADQTTPTLDARSDYDLTHDQQAGNTVVRALNVVATQNGRPLMNAALTSPMTIASGGASNNVGDSALNFSITNLNIADWKPFIGDVVSGGAMNMNGRLLAEQGGERLTFEMHSLLTGLTASVADTRITGADIRLHARGQATQLKRFELGSYEVQLAQQGQPAFELSGSGVYDKESNSANLLVALNGSLARLFEISGRPNLTASSGTIEMKGRVVQTNNIQGVTGDLALRDFTGRFGSNNFNRFGAVMNLDVSKTPIEIQIRNIAGSVSAGGTNGGEFSMSGTYSTNNASRIALKVSDFNQHGLRPFLEPKLTGKQLVSIVVNGETSLDYDPNGDTSVKADLQVANLVVRDPKQPQPEEPLDVKAQLDAAAKQSIAELRRFQIGLTPTDRAPNQLQFQGRVDFTRTNAIEGNLRLTSEGLDLTRYYDLFAGDGGESPDRQPTREPSQTRGVGSPAPETEPEPTRLPFTNFVVETDIRRLYLREMEMTNLLTTVRVNGERISMNPFRAAVNGAPMNAAADIDLGVRGYKYDLNFDARAVPFAPLVNTFAPKHKGQLGGTLSATGHIAGIGTTGASLQRHLTGNFDIGTTNLNLKTQNIQQPALRLIVSTVAALPELFRNPQNALGLLGAAVGTRRGGLANELDESVIDVITARGSAGNGRVELEQAIVRSTVFVADAKGTIALAPVLTNSTINIPVSIYLSRPIAERANIVPANAPTNAAYVQLPDFFTETGTLGDPKPKINYLALGGTVLQGFGIGGGSGQSSGNQLLQGLGSILQGRAGVGTNAPQPGTNAPDGVGTNQPATNQPAPINNLLNELLRPRGGTNNNR